ncbi:hypothetical protein DSECCO2_550250 [anaerobic digester metagenome]
MVIHELNIVKKQDDRAFFSDKREQLEYAVSGSAVVIRGHYIFRHLRGLYTVAKQREQRVDIACIACGNRHIAVAYLPVELQHNGIPGLQNKLAFRLKANRFEHNAGVFTDAVQKAVNEIGLSDAVLAQNQKRRWCAEQKGTVSLHHILHFLCAADHLHRRPFLILSSRFGPSAQKLAVELCQLSAGGDPQFGVQQPADILINLNALIVQPVSLVARHHKLINTLVQRIILDISGK